MFPKGRSSICFHLLSARSNGPADQCEACSKGVTGQLLGSLLAGSMLEVSIQTPGIAARVTQGEEKIPVKIQEIPEDQRPTGPLTTARQLRRCEMPRRYCSRCIESDTNSVCLSSDPVTISQDSTLNPVPAACGLKVASLVTSLS